MAKKEIKAKVKLQCPAGGANRRPRSARRSRSTGEHRRIREAFQRRHDEAKGCDPGHRDGVPRQVFRLVLQDAAASVLFVQSRRIEKGSGEPNRRQGWESDDGAGRRNRQVEGKDLNAASPEAAARVIAGRPEHGLEVVG